MELAIFGIGGSVDLILKLLVLFLIVTYLALVYWTYLDARRRVEDPFLVACATAASLFPFVGTIIYTIVRPPEFLEDREERELELRAAELRLRQLIEQSCPHCEYPIAANYLRCPNCERRLRSPCRKCRKPLDPKWGVCPYCETEVRKRRVEREDAAVHGERRAGRAPAAARAGDSGEPRPSGRGEEPGSRGERPARRDQRQPVRASGQRPEPRRTGGASGSFPGTDRER